MATAMSPRAQIIFGVCLLACVWVSIEIGALLRRQARKHARRWGRRNLMQHRSFFSDCRRVPEDDIS